MARISRRGLLAGAGTGTVLVVGGLAWRAADQGLFTQANARPAFELWREVAEGRLHGPTALVAAGALAASPHNTQPWLFHIDAEGIDLHVVPSRNLGAFDSYRREMMIALGCAAENMVQAAPEQGFSADVQPVEGEATRVARLMLRSGPGEAPLARAIPLRHTDRHRYDVARPVGPEVLSALNAELGDADDVRLIINPSDTAWGRTFAAETIAATQTIIDDPDMEAASHSWTRSSRAEVDELRSGLALDGAGLDRPMEIAGALLPPVSAHAEGGYWLDLTRRVAIPTTSAFGMIVVRDPYNRRACLAAGRLWQRLHLRGVLEGLGMQPLNQIPEMVDRERQLGQPPATANRIAALLPDPQWRPTFGFRLGYPTRLPAPSARRPLQAVLA